jgi:type VI secretion system protein ImpF
MRHPEARHRLVYLPSLLDRLKDDAPHARSEHPDAYAPNADAMRRIIQRDLGLLLNTSNLEAEVDMSDYSQVPSSVVNYGLPPLSGHYLDDRNWDAIETAVRNAILHFESRLIGDSVAVRPLAEIRPASYNKLVFEISGLVQWSPYPLEFRIQSTYDLELNKVTFDRSTRGDN